MKNLGQSNKLAAAAATKYCQEPLHQLQRVLEPHNYYISIRNADDPQRRKVFKGY